MFFRTKTSGPRTYLQVVENRPEAGAVVCLIGQRNVALGHSAATKVLVETAPGPGA